MTNSVPEIENADCIMVMGSNTTGQHPMVASKIMRAKAKGAKLVVVDPRRIPLCEYADLFLQIKPGTNVGMGRDYTIFATADGFVRYEHIQRGRKQVSVHPTRA